MWIFWSSWIVICLNWRSEIVIKKPYCDYVSFRFLRLCFRVLQLLKYRSSHRKCSVKKGILKNFANFTGKHHICVESLFNKFAVVTLLKRDSNGVSSCEICKVLKNTYFEDQLQTWANDCFWQCSSLVINWYMIKALPLGFMVCMKYAFLNRPFYTRRIK